jgi:hypothetical protein
LNRKHINATQSLEKNETTAHYLRENNSIHELTEKTPERVDIQILQILPSFQMNLFRYILGQYISRLSLITFAVYLMLLVPILKYVKFVLHDSIVPYLYIGPLIVTIPYIVFWSWDNNINDINFIDLKFKTFVANQSKLAKLQIKKLLSVKNEKNDYKNKIENEPTNIDLQYINLMSEIDPESMFEEIIKLKATNKLKIIRNNNYFTTDINLWMNNYNIQNNSQFENSEELSFLDLNKNNDSNLQPLTIFDAINIVINKASENNSNSKNETLNKLKEYRDDVVKKL